MKPFRRSQRRRAFGLIKFLCLIAMLGIVVWVVWIFKPELFRVQHVQTPVSADIPDSFDGTVLRIQSESEKTLEKIVVTVFDPKLNKQAKYKIDRLEPEEAIDIGWEWELKPGEHIEVDAEGYLPMAFSAKQFGIQ